MNTFEIELRYEVLDPQQLAQFLSSLKQLHQKRDIDVYLDTHDADLYQRGIFIRLRNNKKLDFKFNRACLDNPQLPIQDYCEEYSFSLPLQPNDLPHINELLVSLNLQPCISTDIENLKSRNNFINHYVVDKLRTSYQHASFTLSVDEVAQLGIFLEIELMAKNIENIDTIKAKMEELLAHLRLKPLKTGYGTLLLRKKDFQNYLLGRFILEEDKKYRTTPQHPRAHPRVGVAVFITNGNKILLGTLFLPIENLLKQEKGNSHTPLNVRDTFQHL